MGNDTCCDLTTHKCRAAVYNWDEDEYLCPPLANAHCKKNSDCATNEFCLVMHNGFDCQKPNVGTCMDVNSIGYTDSSSSIPGIGKVVRRSNSPLTWWSAENWCKAQGMKLVDVREFGCYAAGTTLVIANSEVNRTQCCAEEQLCGSNRDWTNDSAYGETIRVIGQEFVTGQNIWTASSSGYTNSSNCTPVFFIGLRSQGSSVVSMERDASDSCYALCE